MIHLIGNSHITAFSNLPSPPCWLDFSNALFKPTHLGGITAYTFYENHMPFIREYILKIDKEKDWLCFIAGEVDCRVHIPIQKQKQGKSYEEIIKEVIERYFKIYKEVKEAGYKTFVFGAHPPSTLEFRADKPDIVISETYQVRKKITIEWNQQIMHVCNANNIPFVNIYDKLVDENNDTKMEYLWDYCHLQPIKVYDFILTELRRFNII